MNTYERLKELTTAITAGIMHGHQHLSPQVMCELIDEIALLAERVEKLENAGWSEKEVERLHGKADT